MIEKQKNEVLKQLKIAVNEFRDNLINDEIEHAKASISFSDKDDSSIQYEVILIMTKPN